MANPNRPDADPLAPIVARTMTEFADLIGAVRHVNRLARAIRDDLADLPPEGKLHATSPATNGELVHMLAGIGWQGEQTDSILTSAVPIPVTALLGGYRDDPTRPDNSRDAAAFVRQETMTLLGITSLDREADDDANES